LSDVRAVLSPGEVFVDYFVGSKTTVAFAVTADSTRFVELEGPDSPLAERVDLFRSIVASADPALRAHYPVERVADIQRSLGSAVLGWAGDVLHPATRVIVAPDGFFASVPFGALIVGDDVLMAHRDVVQVPSATVLVLQRSLQRNDCVSDPRVVAVTGDDDRLTGARDEARDLARRYGGVESVSSASGVASFEQVTARCDVLHIAAHALVVDHAPWESGIRLAAHDLGETPVDAARANTAGILSTADSMLVAHTFRADPYLRAWQIAKLALPARLAVLSACETAGGRVTRGEGTLGITAAFLSAGVPVVVSSLWPIDDRVTARLMRSFYKFLARGETVATALRLAQLELGRSRAYSHPFFWAGFTVVGDGSMVVEIEERRRNLHPALLAGLGAAFVAVVLVVIQRRRLAASVG
jgi:hypothetical protein